MKSPAPTWLDSLESSSLNVPASQIGPKVLWKWRYQCLYKSFLEYFQKSETHCLDALILRGFQNQEYRFTVTKSRISLNEGKKNNCKVSLLYKQAQLSEVWKISTYENWVWISKTGDVRLGRRGSGKLVGRRQAKWKIPTTRHSFYYEELRKNKITVCSCCSNASYCTKFEKLNRN